MGKFMKVQCLVVRGRKARRSFFEASGRIEPGKTDAVWGIPDLHRLLADPEVDEIRLKVVR